MVRSTQPRFGIVAEPDHEPPGHEPAGHDSGPGYDCARGESRTHFDASTDVDAVGPMGGA